MLWNINNNDLFSKGLHSECFISLVNFGLMLKSPDVDDYFFKRVMVKTTFMLHQAYS